MGRRLRSWQAAGSIRWNGHAITVNHGETAGVTDAVTGSVTAVAAHRGVTGGVTEAVTEAVTAVTADRGVTAGVTEAVTDPVTRVAPLSVRNAARTALTFDAFPAALALTSAS